MLKFYKNSGETKFRTILLKSKSIDQTSQRTRKRIRFFDKTDEEEGISKGPDEKFKESFNLILSKLLTDLKRRVKSLPQFCKQVLILTNLCQMNAEEIVFAASNLHMINAVDIES